MSSLNRVMIIGNLGQDPEIRTTNDGTKLCNLRIATSESWTDKASGEKRERTDWHRAVLWNQNGKRGLVEICEQYLSKGSKVYLEGQLQTRKYQAQDGTDRYSTEIVLRGFDGKLVMLDRKRDGEDFGGGNAGGGDFGAGGPDLGEDSEVPF